MNKYIKLLVYLINKLLDNCPKREVDETQKCKLAIFLILEDGIHEFLNNNYSRYKLPNPESPNSDSNEKLYNKFGDIINQIKPVGSVDNSEENKKCVY